MNVFALFVFLLIFSPLAFGAVEPWSLAVMQTVSFSSLAVLLFNTMKNDKDSLYQIPGIIPLCFLLLFVAAQLVPLPASVVRVIAPSTFELYTGTLSPVTQVDWISLSINRKATLAEFFRIASYGAFYAVTVQLLARRGYLTRTLMIIVVFASILSFLSILQHILSNNKIYWVRNLTMGGSLFGPYVNRNHYAGLMEMVFPLVLSLFLFYKPQIRQFPLRERIARMFNLRQTNIYLLLGFVAVLVATSVFLTLSRMGIVSLSLSLILFGALFLLRGGDRKRGIIIIAICVLVVLSVGWFGWDPIFERFAKIRNPQGDITEQRLILWKDSWNIVRDYPLFGTGFGSFQDIYPKYRTLKGAALADHAHNDYIELLANGGVVALLLAGGFFAVLVSRSFAVFRKRRDPYSRYVFIASLTGIIAILLHSITDFNLQIGANGLYLAFLSGLAVSAANTRMHEGLNDTYLQRGKFPVRTGMVITVLLLISCVVYQSGVIAGKAYFSAVRDSKLDARMDRHEIETLRDKARTASLLDPLDAEYRYAVANTERLLSNKKIAFEQYTGALSLRPTNGEYLQRLGLVLSEMGKYREAEDLLRAGIAYDVSNPARHKRYALWLFARGEKHRGIQSMKRALSLEPHKTRDNIALMVLAGLQDGEIQEAIPENAESSIQFARYLHHTHNDLMEEQAYHRAFEYALDEKPPRKHYFYEVYAVYMKKSRFDRALEVMLKAKEIFPADAGMRIATGTAYEKTGNKPGALEEYRAALALDPKNKEVKKRLETLLTRENKS